MATRKSAPSDRPRRRVQPWREESLIVAGVGGVIAALGHAATGVAIIAVAAAVFLLGFLSRRPDSAPARVVHPKPRPPAARPPRQR